MNAQRALVVGIVALVAGLLIPIVNFFRAHPWVVLVQLGVAIIVGSCAMVVRETGCAQLLPASLQRALGLSTIEIMLSIPQSRSNE